MKVTELISDDSKALLALEAELKDVNVKLREYENLKIALTLAIKGILADVSNVTYGYHGGHHAFTNLYQQQQH
jgi:hypothetical protein